MRRSFCSAVLLLAVLSVLAGCGQKGPLYLPRDPVPVATPAATPAPAPAAEPAAPADSLDEASAPEEAEPVEPIEPTDKNHHAA